MKKSYRFTWHAHRMATKLLKRAQVVVREDPNDWGAMLTIVVAVAYLLPSSSADKGPFDGHRTLMFDADSPGAPRRHKSPR